MTDFLGWLKNIGGKDKFGVPASKESSHDHPHKIPRIDLSEDFWQVDEHTLINPASGYFYEMAVDVFFNSRHFVVMNDLLGPEHSHSYRFRVRCSSETLSQKEQTIVGYHVISERINLLVKAYDNQLLNDLPPFEGIQPTTENLTAILYQQLKRMLADLPVELISVTVWEAPTKAITFSSKGQRVW